MGRPYGIQKSETTVWLAYTWPARMCPTCVVYGEALTGKSHLLGMLNTDPQRGHMLPAWAATSRVRPIMSLRIDLFIVFSFSTIVIYEESVFCEER
jgi:hypothetical protein